MSFFDIKGTNGNNVPVAGNFVCVTEREKGLQIIDVRNPAAHSETGCFRTEAPARGVAVPHSLLYLAAGADGLYNILRSDLLLNGRPAAVCRILAPNFYRLILLNGIKRNHKLYLSFKKKQAALRTFLQLRPPPPESGCRQGK